MFIEKIRLQEDQKSPPKEIALNNKDSSTYPHFKYLVQLFKKQTRFTFLEINFKYNAQVKISITNTEGRTSSRLYLNDSETKEQDKITKAISEDWKELTEGER